MAFKVRLDKSRNQVVSFEDVDDGDMFEYDEEFYMKISCSKAVMMSPSSGVMEEFDGDEKVRIVDAELIIHN